MGVQGVEGVYKWVVRGVVDGGVTDAVDVCTHVIIIIDIIDIIVIIIDIVVVVVVVFVVVGDDRMISVHRNV